MATFRARWHCAGAHFRVNARNRTTPGEGSTTPPGPPAWTPLQPLEPRLLLSSETAPVVWPATGGGNDHAYEVISGEVGIFWHDAASEAEQRGGHLATITSQAENDFIFDLINDPQYWYQLPVLGVQSHGPWIGGFKPDGPSAEAVGEGWQWVSGEAWGYANGASFEPNRSYERYVHFVSRGQLIDDVRDNDEPTLEGWTIYQDSNDNGGLDEGEPTTLTNPDGSYLLHSLDPGMHAIRSMAPIDHSILDRYEIRYWESKTKVSASLTDRTHFRLTPIDDRDYHLDFESGDDHQFDELQMRISHTDQGKISATIIGLSSRSHVRLIDKKSQQPPLALGRRCIRRGKPFILDAGWSFSTPASGTHLISVGVGDHLSDADIGAFRESGSTANARIIAWLSRRTKGLGGKSKIVV